MRVEPSIAIVAGLGVLALGLLVAWGWFGAVEAPPSSGAGARASEAETRSASRGGQGPDRDGGHEADASALRVGGSIVDDESGPLTEGRVDLVCEDGRLGSRVRVDDEGNFEGPACSGQTCARLVHPVFEQPEAWAFEPGSVRELAVVRAGGFAGTVVSTLGEPIPNANLLLRRGELRATARSDADGGFALALPRERPCDACDRPGVDRCRAAGDRPTTDLANLLVWAPEFAPRELEVALDGQDSLELVLSPPAPAITGRIIGADGMPIGLRIMVLAINLEREAEQHAAEVDADGSFSFADLADAHYRIRAIRDGHELAVLDSAAPGDQVELRIERALHASDLRVEVRDADDRPTSGARVDGGPFRGAKTDEAGQVEAQDVLPGSYTLSVRVPGCPIVRMGIEVPADTEAAVHELLRLPADCVISGPD
jgi:hypothetical protein